MDVYLWICRCILACAVCACFPCVVDYSLRLTEAIQVNVNTHLPIPSSKVTRRTTTLATTSGIATTITYKKSCKDGQK
jgi:hypothetical protein